MENGKILLLEKCFPVLWRGQGGFSLDRGTTSMTCYKQFLVQIADRQRKQEFRALEASFILAGVHGRLQRVSGSEPAYTLGPLSAGYLLAVRMFQNP